jgi:hypothetical protein
VGDVVDAVQHHVRAAQLRTAIAVGPASPDDCATRVAYGQSARAGDSTSHSATSASGTESGERRAESIGSPLAAGYTSSAALAVAWG